VQRSHACHRVPAARSAPFRQAVTRESAADSAEIFEHVGEDPGRVAAQHHHQIVGLDPNRDVEGLFRIVSGGGSAISVSTDSPSSGTNVARRSILRVAEAYLRSVSRARRRARSPWTRCSGDDGLSRGLRNNPQPHRLRARARYRHPPLDDRGLQPIQPAPMTTIRPRCGWLYAAGLVLLARQVSLQQRGPLVGVVRLPFPMSISRPVNPFRAGSGPPSLRGGRRRR
jgi:hypothetical protein